MAKWIKYVLANGAEKALSYSQEHLDIAKKESRNGEYVIEDIQEEEGL